MGYRNIAKIVKNAKSAIFANFVKSTEARLYLGSFLDMTACVARSCWSIRLRKVLVGASLT